MSHLYKPMNYINMHRVTYRNCYLVFSLLLLVFSSAAIGDETNRDIVLILDKGIDLRSIKDEIGTVFDQLEKAENNTRIAVIGFDAVVTDIASLSLASEGGSRVLLDALTNEGDISSSSNVAAGIERGISELNSQETVAVSKTIIVFSDGNIQTGSEQSNQDYRSWLVDVLTQSAARSEIRIFWVSTNTTEFIEFIQKVVKFTEGDQYLINEVVEGKLVKSVLTAVAQASDGSEIENPPINDDVAISETSEAIDVTPTPESEPLDVETAAEPPLQNPVSVESTEINTEILEEIAEQPKEKTSAMESIKSVSENLSQDFASIFTSIREWSAGAIKTSRGFISTQSDKQMWLIALLGLLTLMIVSVLLIRIFTNKKAERVDPVIVDKTAQSPELPVGDAEELFVDAVMQKAESAKGSSMDSKPGATRKPELKTSIQKESEASPTQPLAEGVKIRDQSSSNDRTAIRPAQK